MKRSMGGGSYRGPVGLLRQRRTIRFVQICLVVLAAASLMFAGYTLGRVRGFDEGRHQSRLGAPKPASPTETGVLGVVGLVALLGAVLLQGQGGVRVPVPARLEELTGRVGSTASERAGEAASETPG